MGSDLCRRCSVMSRGLLLGVALLASTLAAAGPLSGADQPPKDLHLVGDHWTAWNPPTSFPEGTQVYTIVPGDTLWALANRFYNNPYLWPQIWERNQYILDAHWIYPGDPLVTGLAVTPPATETAEVEDATVPAAPGVEVGTETAAAPLTGVQTPGQAVGAPVPLGTEDDNYC